MRWQPRPRALRQFAVCAGGGPVACVLAVGAALGAGWLGYEIWKTADSADKAGDAGDKVSDPEVKPKDKSTPFTPDQQAVIELAKEAARTGLSEEEANALIELALEAGLTVRGPETHPGRKFKDPHIHIGPINHIPVR
jgi:hypothetical protein